MTKADRFSTGLTRRAVFPALAAASLAPDLSWAQPAFRWPKDARAAVSLTYDDGLNSQIENAAPDLERHGFRGTFFLTEDNMRDRLPDWEALSRAGHEIADHTVSHPCVLGKYSAARFKAAELGPMERYLNQHFGGPRPRAYAYPCGYLGLGRGPEDARFARYQQALHGRFLAARTTAGPPNDPRKAVANRFHLDAYEPTEDADRAAPAIAYINEAIAGGAWALLVFHEILPRRLGAEDTSIAVHRRILDHIAQMPVWCAPMEEAFRYIEREDARRI